MRSAAVTLTQHRRSRRLATVRYDRAQPRRIVGTHGIPRRDNGNGNGNRNAAQALPRPERVRAVRRRFRPDALIPRGFLPLVVH